MGISYTQEVSITEESSQKEDIESPVTNPYFEDYVPESVHEFGNIVSEKADMINFA